MLIRYLRTMEGGAFYYTSEAAQIIADHEEAFSRGTRCDERFQIEGLKPEHWAAFSSAQGSLLHHSLRGLPAQGILADDIPEPGGDRQWQRR